jgi:hypothetical protein
MMVVGDAIGEVEEPGEMVDDDETAAGDEGGRGEGDGGPGPGEVGEIDGVGEDAEQGE